MPADWHTSASLRIGKSDWNAALLEAIEAEKAVVAHDHDAVGIEQANALRHAIQRGIELAAALGGESRHALDIGAAAGRPPPQPAATQAT